MKDFKDKVAVITGGASGMGRAFADRFGADGCKIVIADVEEPTLNQAIKELEANGVEATGVVTDVSNAKDMDALGKLVFEKYGTVNLLFNNAGVATGGPLVDASIQDWEWVIGVNLFGVIHGLRVFLPHMQEHGDAHIVNTASVAGLLSYPQMAVYNTTKHAVVTISETLYNELQQSESNLGISVLCPGIVNTKITESERNRPEQATRPLIPDEPSEENDFTRNFVMDIYAQSLDPSVVAEQVKTGIVENQFYIWTDLVYEDAIINRMDDIVNRKNPTPRKHLLEEDQNKRF